ncbi:MAG TPA: acyltransferase [Sphingomicrobium sp.]|jgi:peptidoglycan/LPS O-acetylase OafA/YrhL|nr:acyltransferase [Sphingomicrobium sp.]
MQGDIRRFYLLDALRGLAALAVVLWHWRHFFRTPTVVVEKMPLHALLLPVYTNGLRAVDLFFCLSGFVFHWLYAKRIADGATSGREFFVLRFSRLYPLHLLTLLLVLFGQLAVARSTGRFFIYADNDALHFLSQLVLAPPSALDRSFNGPAWSLSVEVLLYTIFFFACRHLSSRKLCIALGLAAGLILWPEYPLLARGLFSFFAGGVAYFTYDALIRRGVNLTRSIGAVAAVGWLLTLVQLRGHIFELSDVAALLWTGIFLFPTTVLALALLETGMGSLCRPLAIFGEMSYSSYLLHFPLQLALLLGARALGMQPHYDSPALLLAFLIVLAVVSLCSYRYFEMPVQELIRRQFAQPRNRASRLLRHA